jgi:acyl-CoA reductase-like NAD-dependent aldehyde dehydrogenase
MPDTAPAAAVRRPGAPAEFSKGSGVSMSTTGTAKTSARHEVLRDSYPYYLANAPRESKDVLEVRDKYTGETATRVARADPAVVDEAIARATEAARPMRQLPACRRQEVLDTLVDKCRQRRDELAVALCIEAGKPIQHARGEADRLIDTLRISAEESVRIDGEVMTLDISPRAAGYRGMTKRVPIGACGFITPWNFPLNLVAHKIGPALACGCPFILKPASHTPVGALILAEMLAETDLPPGAFSVLPLKASDASGLVEDDRIKRLSFTGSAEVGWALKDRCRKKHITLELGGNAAVIVDADTDLDDAVARIVFGAFYQSGQSCISVQRIYAHAAIYDALREKLVTAATALKTGDPLDEDTFVGPIISEADAATIEGWVTKAVDAGARLLCGGERRGALIDATLLENVAPHLKVNCEEVFGPVAVLHRFDDFVEAIAAANDSRYGLQAGVFTRDIDKAHYAWDELEVGGVVINDVPSWRVDHMPYGGVKDSGIGREGIRWAIEEMTELRLMVVRSTTDFGGDGS